MLRLRNTLVAAHLRAAAGKAPPGYTVVNTDPLASPNQTQQRGIVQCPTGTVPLGGGVFVTSVSTLANVNSSFPTATGWAGDVNNASGADTTFVVQVDCGTRPVNYRVVHSTRVDNPAGQNQAAVACPQGSKPLGGGGLSSAGDLFVNMNSTFPLGRSWLVDENNATGSDQSIQAFAVCGKLPAYAVVRGLSTPSPVNSQSSSHVTCPSPKVPVGGGVLSGAANVGVNLNASITRAQNDWESFINNASGVDTVATPFVVCAGT